KLELEEDAREWLANKGYDPAYGARPLKRVIQKEVQDPLAERILLGDILDESIVKILSGSDRLNFRSIRTGPSEEAVAAGETAYNFGLNFKVPQSKGLRHLFHVNQHAMWPS